jgi:ApbE superfamily uncharacterized protein (UPF0280 family)
VVYEPRDYRVLHREEDLHHFQVMIRETDLDIGIKKGQFSTGLKKKVELLVSEERKILKNYIKAHSEFLTTLEPYVPKEDAPPVVVEMCRATKLAGVGPMASVAGYFAEKAGAFLARYSRDVIVENGGDIWMKSDRIRRVSIFAGSSPFSHRIGLEIGPKRTPLGICTSSATVGPSLSFGKADAVVILAPTAVLADAVATAAGNIVQDYDDLEKSVDLALGIPGVIGAVAIMADKMAVRGEIKLIPV